MTAYRPRWKVDAGGFVAPYGGLWAGVAFNDRDELERILRATPNGDQIEIVEVDG
jgi:hypothetical protein